MNILIVTGIFYPDSGGPSIYLKNLISELKESSTKVKAVITLSENLNTDGYHKTKIIRIRRKQNKIIRRIKTMLNILLYSFNVDLVYVNGLELESIFVCKFLLKKKVILKIVGDRIWEYAQNNKLSIESIDKFQEIKHNYKFGSLIKIRKYLFNKVDGIIVPSFYLRKIVEGWGVKKPILNVIYNSNNEKQTKYFTKKKQFDLITVCRLVPWKGIETLIKICQKNNLSINIVGDGPLESELKLLSGKDLNKLIFFSGKLPSNKIVNEIKKAKVFILNSSYEGLPHVLIESMKSRTPIICSDVGGNSELIKHNFNGILFQYNNNKEMEAEITKLLKNENLRKVFTDNAIKHTLPNFSSKIMTSNTLKFFTEIILK